MMKPRLLTPFLSAVAGSALLLVAMFALGGTRVQQAAFEMLEAPVAQAESASSDGITLTWEADPSVLLGDETVFTGTIEVAETTTVSMTWDYDNDGVNEVDTTALFSEGITITAGTSFSASSVDVDTLANSLLDTPLGTFRYVYAAAGDYTPVANVFIVDGDVITPLLTVETTTEVVEPEIDVEVSTDTPALGEEITVDITVENGSASLIDEISVDFGDDTGTTIDYMTGTMMYSVTKLYTTSGTFDIAGELVLTGAYEDEFSDTEAVSVAPEVTLTVDPTTVNLGQPISYTVGIAGIDPAAIESVQVEFGDGSAPVVAEAGTYIYTTTGSFDAFATVVTGDVYEDDITSEPVVVTVASDGTPVLNVVAADTTLTAGSRDAAERTSITATLTVDGTPQPNEIVTLAISSTIGGKFTSVGGAVLSPTMTIITGTTNASGEVAARLRGGPVAGGFLLTGVYADATNSQTITVELAPGAISQPATNGAVFDFGDGDVVTLDDVGGLPTGTIATFSKTAPMTGEEMIDTDSELPYFALRFYDLAFLGPDGEEIDVVADAPSITIAYTDTILSDTGATTATLQQSAVRTALESTLTLASEMDSEDGMSGEYMVADPASVTLNADDNTIEHGIDGSGTEALVGLEQAPAPPTIYLPFVRRTV